MRTKGILLVICSAVLWALVTIMLRILNKSIEPEIIVFWQYAIAFLLFLPFSKKIYSELKRLTKKDFFFLVFSSVIGIGGGAFFFNYALKYLNAGIVMVLLRLEVIFVILISLFFLRETYPKRFFLYVIICIIGASLIVYIPYSPLTLKSSLLLGAVFSLLSAFCWALSITAAKELLYRYTPTAINATRFFFLILLFFFIININNNIFSFDKINGNWFLLISVGVLTAISFFVFHLGLKQIKAGEATIADLSVVIFTIMFGYIFLDETLTAMQIIGSLILLFSIYKIAQLKKDEVVVGYDGL